MSYNITYTSYVTVIVIQSHIIQKDIKGSKIIMLYSIFIIYQSYG